MKELRIYEYMAGKGFRRFTVTGNSLPDEQRLSEGKWMRLGSPELSELYSDPKAVTSQVYWVSARPWDFNGIGALSDAYIRSQVPEVARIFTDAALDILENADPRVSCRYLNKLQHSVCSGIATVLSDVGLSTKVVKLDLSKMEATELKGWHTVACSVTSAEGIEMNFSISPLFNVFMKRARCVDNVVSCAPVMYACGKHLEHIFTSFHKIEWG